MRKFLKIFGITAGCVLGVVVIGICTALYIVFTPKRLTPIVRNVAQQYITCPHNIGDVELTFFSTFPDFGLQIDGIYVINPMDGAPSDTLLAVPEAVVVINPIKLLKDKELDIRKVLLDRVSANLFIDETGKSNMDVVALTTDTTTTADTTGFSLPFENLNIDKLSANIDKISYLSAKDSMDVRLAEVVLEAKARSLDDIDLHLGAGNINATIGEIEYARQLRIDITSDHTAFNADSMLFVLRQASIGINKFAIEIAGNISMQDDIMLDINLQTNEWQVPDLLKLLPDNIALPKGTAIKSGSIKLQADAKGVYNDSVMPIIDANLRLTDGAGCYKELYPYEIKEIGLNADAHIDLNDSTASLLNIRQLHACTQQSTIDISGNVSELLADMLCDIDMDIRLNLPDIMPILPKETSEQLSAEGRIDGDLHAKIRLSDLTEMNLKKGDISGNIHCKALDAAYDSMLIKTPNLALTFRIPNRKPQHKTTNWLTATLQTEGIRCNMPAMEALSGKAEVQLETSDILSNNPIIYAACALQSESLQAKSDSMSGTLQTPALTLYAEYDTKDTAHIPVLNANLTFRDLEGQYATNQAHLTQSELSASVSGGKRDKTIPRLKLKLTTEALKAAIGEDLQVETKQISIGANARYNQAYDNVLLQWNPRLNVTLTDGIINMASFRETIQIPAIDFDYSNKVCHISDSRIVIGKSDFALTGEIDNIGKWLKNEAVLTGELNFVSNHTDVNELMLLTSSDTGSEETPTTEQQENKNNTTEQQPYLVPTTVDLTLNTMIKEAAVFDQVATNLGGKLYVRNGILVLEEMGFICNAARLQLTAMYKTPRRNHLYLGLDYHMLDINIEELVNMIPQIDSMMPMLRSFRGNAEFHLAAETYLNSKYELKTSTTRGACSISGKDLVLLDSETFGQIAKLLMFSKKTENKVDSISAEITLFKNEIDIYPFCLSIDNYMAAVGGRHNLDMTFDYHISLLKPLYIGVDVSGSFDDLKIKLAKCRYAQDFRPIFRRETDTQNAKLRQTIKASLQKNVKQ